MIFKQILHNSSIKINDYYRSIEDYLVLVLQVFQLHLLSANIFFHLIKAVEELEGLVQGKPLWIYSNLIIVILYA